MATAQGADGVKTPHQLLRFQTGRFLHHLEYFLLQLDRQHQHVRSREIEFLKRPVTIHYRCLLNCMSAILDPHERRTPPVCKPFVERFEHMRAMVDRYHDRGETTEKNRQIRDVIRKARLLRIYTMEYCIRDWAPILYGDQEWFEECQTNSPELIPLPAAALSQDEPPKKLTAGNENQKYSFEQRKILFLAWYWIFSSVVENADDLLSHTESSQGSQVQADWKKFYSSWDVFSKKNQHLYMLLKLAYREIERNFQRNFPGCDCPFGVGEVEEAYQNMVLCRYNCFEEDFHKFVGAYSQSIRRFRDLVETKLGTTWQNEFLYPRKHPHVRAPVRTRSKPKIQSQAQTQAQVSHSDVPVQNFLNIRLKPSGSSGQTEGLKFRPGSVIKAEIPGHLIEQQSGEQWGGEIELPFDQGEDFAVLVFCQETDRYELQEVGRPVKQVKGQRSEQGQGRPEARFKMLSMEQAVKELEEHQQRAKHKSTQQGAAHPSNRLNDVQGKVVYTSYGTEHQQSRQDRAKHKSTQQSEAHSSQLQEQTYVQTQVQPQGQPQFQYQGQPEYQYHDQFQYQGQPQFQYQGQPQFQYQDQPPFQYQGQPQFHYQYQPQFQYQDQPQPQFQYQDQPQSQYQGQVPFQYQGQPQFQYQAQPPFQYQGQPPNQYQGQPPFQ